MDRELKKIIVLRDIQPKIFEEVILVLKKEINENKIDLVDQATEIVNNYISRNKGIRYNSYQKSIPGNNRINIILNTSLALSCLLFIMLLIRAF